MMSTTALRRLGLLPGLTLLCALSACVTAPPGSCTAYDPQAAPDTAQALAAVLKNLHDNAGLEVMSVDGDVITMLPPDFCRPPVQVSYDALRAQALAAIQRGNYTRPSCGTPPIVIPSACMARDR